MTLLSSIQRSHPILAQQSINIHQNQNAQNERAAWFGKKRIFRRFYRVKANPPGEDAKTTAGEAVPFYKSELHGPLNCVNNTNVASQHELGRGSVSFPDASSSSVKDDLTAKSLVHFWKNSPSSSNIDISDGVGFRLAMIGLNPNPSETNVDELRSDLYSSTLDTFRGLVETYIPEAEELVSWAVINAFNNELADSRTTENSASTVPFDSTEFELDTIREAYEWLNSKQSDYAFHEEANEESLGFLQTITNSVVNYCIKGQLSAHDACRTLISTSLVLGATTDTTVENDTLIFNRMNKDITADDLNNLLGKYGKVVSVTISENGGFGICRFGNVSSIDTIMGPAKNEILTSLGPIAYVTPHALFPKQLQQVYFEDSSFLPTNISSASF